MKVNTVPDLCEAISNTKIKGMCAHFALCLSRVWVTYQTVLSHQHCHRNTFLGKQFDM